MRITNNSTPGRVSWSFDDLLDIDWPQVEIYQYARASDHTVIVLNASIDSFTWMLNEDELEAVILALQTIQKSIQEQTSK